MKIRFISRRPHSFQFGGFDMQMINAMNAVRACRNIKISPLDFWNRNSDYDILHFWGLNDYPKGIEIAYSQNKKIVLTALLPYFDTKKSIAAHKFKSFFDREKKVLLKSLSYLDKLVVVNELQKECAIKYWKMAPSNVIVIPNIVHDYSFIATQREGGTDVFPSNDYVLTVGNVCSRKAQLNLAMACYRANVNLIIVGKVLDKEKEYGEKLEKLIKPISSIHWIKGLEEKSPELGSLFKNCRLYALPSFAETQPISALEASFLSKPLLLGNFKYAKQDEYKNASLANPRDIKEIAKKIKQIYNNPNKYINYGLDKSLYSFESIGKKYTELYESL